MQQFRPTEKEDTRLTQYELEMVLNRWREDKENTVSVSDVAEALHCSPAEIEALVWRARAEGVTTPTKKTLTQEVSLRAVMVVILGLATVCLLVGNLTSPYSDRRGFFLISAGALFAVWTIYATFCVLVDAANRKE